MRMAPLRRCRRSADGTDVAVGGVQVKAAVIDPALNRTVLSTVATDGNGRATFTGLTITGAAGQYLLDFTASGYVENAVTVDVAAGP